jgi:hypothetical protein
MVDPIDAAVVAVEPNPSSTSIMLVIEVAVMVPGIVIEPSEQSNETCTGRRPCRNA